MAPFHIETEVLVLQFAMLKQFSGCIKNFRQDTKGWLRIRIQILGGTRVNLILILNTATSVITLLL